MAGADLPQAEEHTPDTASVSAVPPAILSPAEIDLERAAACIGIEGQVSYETLDTAYWQYVERYSPDAVENLTDDEIRARCAELSSRQAEPAELRPASPAPDASRDECLSFLSPIVDHSVWQFCIYSLPGFFIEQWMRRVPKNLAAIHNPHG